MRGLWAIQVDMLSRKPCVAEDKGIKYFKKEREGATVSKAADMLKMMKD